MIELTATKPKSLLIFDGQPILSHILVRIFIPCAGSCEVILATSCGSDQIKDF
jgi:NDP-sugar pyrophosphorylase family protein